MTAVTVLTVILLVAATAACIAVIWLAREAALSARSARQLTDDVNARLTPLLEKADVTVDALNAELLRIDGVITRFEEAGERVGSVTSTVSEIVQAPTEIATGVAERIRQRWRTRKHETAERDAAEKYVVTETPAPETSESEVAEETYLYPVPDQEDTGIHE